VLAELHYMILTRHGPGEELALLDEVGQGIPSGPFSTEDIAEAQAMIERYISFGDVGLADASNVVLATRYGTRDILTLDGRHFRAIYGPKGRPFRLLPADL